MKSLEKLGLPAFVVVMAVLPHLLGKCRIVITRHELERKLGVKAVKFRDAIAIEILEIRRSIIPSILSANVTTLPGSKAVNDRIGTAARGIDKEIDD